MSVSSAVPETHRLEGDEAAGIRRWTGLKSKHP
jgi:hypothetical protein